MTDVTTPAVLDVSILTDMYGDDSAKTIHHALSSFLQEATTYVNQLQQKAMQQQQSMQHDYSSIARMSHSLKSMAGLVGACQLQLLCDSIEQAARKQDHAALIACWPQFNLIWPVLHTELINRLSLYGRSDA